MAATELEICNAALSRLGAPAITSFSDQDKRSQSCALVYPRTRDHLLRSHPWKFALKRVALTPHVSVPAFGYSAQFALPADYLRIFRLDFPDIEYKIEGGFLLCDESTINMIYIAKITDVTKFEPMFDHLLGVMLAHELSYSLVQSASLKLALAQEVQILLRDVRSADAQEGTPYDFEFNTWVEARY
jgi:hypothetical protein